MPADTVILVHGLWMTGLELGILQHRLEDDHGFNCLRFSYRSVTGSMTDHVRQLRELAQAQQADRLHFVGHSLGGVVIYNLLTATQDLPSGRAVLLGSPIQGSRAAETLAQWKLGRAAIGSAVRDELINCAPRRWDGRRDIGTLAGSLNIGLGRIVDGALATGSDGTIRLDETRLDGAADHIELNLTHTSMVFSPVVARQVAIFLRTGKFDHSEA